MRETTAARFIVYLVRLANEEAYDVPVLEVVAVDFQIREDGFTVFRDDQRRPLLSVPTAGIRYIERKEIES